MSQHPGAYAWDYARHCPRVAAVVAWNRQTLASWTRHCGAGASAERRGLQGQADGADGGILFDEGNPQAWARQVRPAGSRPHHDAWHALRTAWRASAARRSAAVQVLNRVSTDIAAKLLATLAPCLVGGHLSERVARALQACLPQRLVDAAARALLPDLSEHGRLLVTARSYPWIFSAAPTTAVADVLPDVTSTTHLVVQCFNHPPRPVLSCVPPNPGPYRGMLTAASRLPFLTSLHLVLPASRAARAAACGALARTLPALSRVHQLRISDPDDTLPGGVRADPLAFPPWSSATHAQRHMTQLTHLDVNALQLTPHVFAPQPHPMPALRELCLRDASLIHSRMASIIRAAPNMTSLTLAEVRGRPRSKRRNAAARHPAQCSPEHVSAEIGRNTALRMLRIEHDRHMAGAHTPPRGVCAALAMHVASCAQLRHVELVRCRGPPLAATLHALAALPGLRTLCVDTRPTLNSAPPPDAVPAAVYATLQALGSLTRLRLTGFVLPGGPAAGCAEAVARLSRLSDLELLQVSLLEVEGNDSSAALAAALKRRMGSLRRLALGWDGSTRWRSGDYECVYGAVAHLSKLTALRLCNLRGDPGRLPGLSALFAHLWHLQDLSLSWVHKRVMLSLGEVVAAVAALEQLTRLELGLGQHEMTVEWLEHMAQMLQGTRHWRWSRVCGRGATAAGDAVAAPTPRGCNLQPSRLARLQTLDLGGSEGRLCGAVRDALPPVLRSLPGLRRFMPPREHDGHAIPDVSESNKLEWRRVALGASPGLVVVW